MKAVEIVLGLPFIIAGWLWEWVTRCFESGRWLYTNFGSK